MLSIIEICNDLETIVANVKSIDEFISYTKSLLVNDDYTYITDIQPDTLLADTYDSTKYLLCTNNIITYTEKIKIVKKGYLYNVNSYKLDKLRVWKAIPNSTLPDQLPKEEIFINKIKCLEPKNIKKNSNIIIIGQRDTGKTNLIKNILKNFDDKFIKNSLIISPQDNSVPFYNKHFDCTIDHTININTIWTLLDNQEEGAIIFDDCLNSNMAIQYDNMINTLFDSNKMIILTFQWPFGSALKYGPNYYFFLANNCFVNQKKIHELTGLFETFQEFKENFLKLTDSYSSMVINNNLPNQSVTDRILFYKSVL